MRSLHLALLVASVPGAAFAQDSPRSAALELGFSTDSAELLGGRTPVALFATWWLQGDLDASARVAWGVAVRPGVRAADGCFEAGGGLRYSVASWSVLRPQLVADVAVVQVFGAPGSEVWASEAGLRVGAGLAMEMFLSRDLSLSLVARGTDLWLASGEGGLGLSLASRMAIYF